MCQLTGDIDWETGLPTSARTLTRFGVDAVDLGYPVEQEGKLVLLFGDTWPSNPSGPGGEVSPNDAVGVVKRTALPTSNACLGLTIHHTPPAYLTVASFIPATIVGPTPVKQGWFNVPSGGVSIGGALDTFFWTNHCSKPHKLLPSPNAPLARPSGDSNCPETDERNSIGKGVLARSSDMGFTFRHVVSMPVGFVYSIAVNLRSVDVPSGQQLGTYIFGVPRYRASTPYLAYAHPGMLSDPTKWWYFGGRDVYGLPRWVPFVTWQKVSPWKPPAGAEVLSPVSNKERCIGEFSVTWNKALQSWLMLYNCKSEIEGRIARAPWGPWSMPTTLLNVNAATQCRLVMAPSGCGSRETIGQSRAADRS